MSTCACGAAIHPLAERCVACSRAKGQQSQRRSQMYRNGISSAESRAMLNRDKDAASAERVTPKPDVTRYVYSGGVRYRVHSADVVVNTNGEYPGMRGDFLRAPSQVPQYTRRKVTGARPE
jgi:hypothetical protein